MLWRNFANLFGMHTVVLRHCFSIYIFGQGKFRIGAYTSDNDRLSVENFDGQNVDELIKIRQIRQYFPLSKICAIRW